MALPLAWLAGVALQSHERALTAARRVHRDRRVCGRPALLVGAWWRRGWLGALVSVVAALGLGFAASA